MRPFRTVWACALALIGFALAGCSQVKLIPVEGTVTVGTAPLTKGEVTYHPDAAAGNNAKYADLPRGKINDQGKYSLSTGGKAGAPAGKYKVTVNPNAGEAPADYSIPKDVIEKSSTDLNSTTLTREVKEGAAAGSYDLKVAPPTK